VKGVYIKGNAVGKKIRGNLRPTKTTTHVGPLRPEATREHGSGKEDGE
jgi:hypothetical protein